MAANLWVKKMGKKVIIDPITRLEGHGKIRVDFDDAGEPTHTFFQVPDFKGFEKFCEGRAVEEMPALTQKICGVCPTAHHIAGSKALDRVFNVQPPATAVKLRELMHLAFIYEDHLLHFYFLGGPDLLVGPGAPDHTRNIFGIVDTVGETLCKKAIEIRKKVRELNGIISGDPLYPVCGLPGGVSGTISELERGWMRQVAGEAVDFAQQTMALYHERILKRSAYNALMTAEPFHLKTYYMGLVDDDGFSNFYEGKVKVVDPDGNPFALFDAEYFAQHLEERVQVANYLKLMYLKKIGWRGLTEGKRSGIYRVGPLARLNVSNGYPTVRAHAEYETMIASFGGKPVHNTFAYHWARLIEVLYAAERMVEIVDDREITGSHVRNLPQCKPDGGTGVCEAPRGTLFHHYRSDGRGIVTAAHLVVATQNNAAAISLSIGKAARAVARDGVIPDRMLNLVEMAFRAYDPCLACATH